MTLSDLRDRILDRAGRTGDTTLNDSVKYALESVQDEITSDIDFPETLKFDQTSLLLVADTQFYSLPADFGRMIQIWDTATFQSELQRLTPPEYKMFVGDVTGQHGTNPRYYDILDNLLVSTTYRKRIEFLPFPETILNGVIATFTDYSATVAGTVEITDVDHGLATGDSITIAGTTNYDGVEVVTKIDDDNFYITATYVAEAGGATKLWTKNHYIPMVYERSLDYLSADSDSNILTDTYPTLYVEGGAYYLYRDVIYKDDPAKIAFRRAEFQKVKDQVMKASGSPDKIHAVLPKRILPSRTSYPRVQTTGYTS